MRLWHKDLIEFLPKKQLVAQLRECVAIASNIYHKGSPKHCLVNPVMKYDACEFNSYIKLVIDEFHKRKYKVSEKTLLKLNIYLPLQTVYLNKDKIFKNWHDAAYLKICYYNLLEKYKCSSITEEEFEPILKYYLSQNSILERDYILGLSKGKYYG